MQDNYKGYFYNLNWQINEDDICRLEMKCLFNVNLDNKYIVSDIYVDPTRSRFIKSSISVIYQEDTLEDIIQNIKTDKLSYDNFKVTFVKYDGIDVEYKNRLLAIKEIGLVITGEPDIHNPRIILGVTKANGKWLFGIYKQHDASWHIHDSKPYKYSNALGISLARSIINMAIANDLNMKIIDPCCGIGTVILEALSQGLNIQGYEINAQIAANAKRNLEFFGYENVITTGDMHNINEHFDVAIVDLPYGLFTPTTIDIQREIIKTSRRISDKAIIITFEDMTNEIIDAGFYIMDSCKISKGKFTRYINICK